LKVTKEIIKKLEHMFGKVKTTNDWCRTNNVEPFYDCKNEFYLITQLFDKEKSILIKSGIVVYMIPIELAEKALVLGRFP
jgi:hypothetical protein